MTNADGSSGNRTPSFLTVDSRVPAVLRDLLNEAEGCLNGGFLTGGTACMQRAIQVVLSGDKVEGADVQSRIRSLSEKHSSLPRILVDVLQQFGDATSREGAKLSANGLNLLIVTIKAMLYEIWVLGPERAERLEYVRKVFESIERKNPEKRAAQSPAESVAV